MFKWVRIIIFQGDEFVKIYHSSRFFYTRYKEKQKQKKSKNKNKKYKTKAPPKQQKTTSPQQKHNVSIKLLNS